MPIHEQSGLDVPTENTLQLFVGYQELRHQLSASVVEAANHAPGICTRSIGIGERKN